jgi:hypothetical protein
MQVSLLNGRVCSEKCVGDILKTENVYCYVAYG